MSRPFLGQLQYIGLACSAAVGSLAMMVSAARLLRVVMATAKGVSPCLSLRLRFMEGCPSSSEIITEFWLVMATCRGVFPSESWVHSWH